MEDKRKKKEREKGSQLTNHIYHSSSHIILILSGQLNDPTLNFPTVLINFKSPPSSDTAISQFPLNKTICKMIVNMLPYVLNSLLFHVGFNPHVIFALISSCSSLVSKQEETKSSENNCCFSPALQCQLCFATDIIHFVHDGVIKCCTYG